MALQDGSECHGQSVLIVICITSGADAFFGSWQSALSSNPGAHVRKPLVFTDSDIHEGMIFFTIGL